MKIIVCIIISYLLGSINPAYIFGRLHGFDIRERGTKNAGASNTKVLLGTKYAAVVVLYDIGKAILAVLLVRHFFHVTRAMEIICGCACVIGHIFPFYLGFRGGKGFASYIGLGFVINWKVFLIVMAIGLALALLSNWIVAATISLSVAMPIVAILYHLSIFAILALLLTSTIILLKHIPNFKRIVRKQEIGINGKPAGIALIKD